MADLQLDLGGSRLYYSAITTAHGLAWKEGLEAKRLQLSRARLLDLVNQAEARVTRVNSSLLVTVERVNTWLAPGPTR